MSGGRVAVSVIIAARNEEANIAGCVASVASWASEVIVVENDSTDRTVMLAAAEGATVFSHPFETIGQQRNAAIVRAANEWILVLDADERCTPELAAEIRAVSVAANAEGPNAFRVVRRNFFLGKEVRHGGWGSDKPVRLFRRSLRYDDRKVHEHVITDSPPGTLRHSLIHHPYAGLDQYFEKFDRYSGWWAAQQFAAGRRVSASAILIRPPARFLSTYLLRGGWRDGAHGLVLAVLAAMSVGAKYARLWALARPPRR